MNRARDSILTDNVIIRNEEDNTQQKVSKNNLYGLNEAYEYAQDQLSEQFATQQAPSDLAYAFFRAIFQPSLKYMRALTLRERERAAQQIMAIQGGVEEGEIIVSQGEQVDAEIKRKLTSLERERNDRLDAPIPWKQFTGELLLSIAIYLLFFLFLYFLEQRLFANTRAILIISLLFAFAVGLFSVVVRLPEVALYIVPVAVVSVLFTIVFHSRLGLMGTLTLAMLGGSMLGFDLEYTLATFFAGMLGVFSVRDIKDRGQFFISALIVFAGFVVVLTASWLYMGTPLERYGWDVLFAGVGASFIIASQILLWIVERSFGVTTDLTLLELSDTNRPLLKELSLRAPGTFNHSLQVANLAEAAADRIGANSLLARVGALYHDIGKMLKPKYYVENQRAGVNPHDKLKPRMSALIIASHVKEGLEMAKEYNLPPRVLQFIPTHHGTTRIEYFYRRALEQTDDESNVLESEFRYPGPRPDTKETGILMLADSVEAACRSLDDPTHNRIKSLIDIIFRQHIDDGQLDNTDLTFRDLSTIRETFLSMLMGVYHVRVKYPDQDDEQDADIADSNGISDVLHVEPRATANISIVLDDNIWSGSDVGINITDLERAAESETIDQNEPPEANGRRAGERDEASVQERETARGSLDQRQE
jgi:putative nucleotidyltransferase with HDIG domain